LTIVWMAVLVQASAGYAQPHYLNARQPWTVGAMPFYVQLAQNEGPVTLEQVLRDPDNIDLNLRYARQLIDEGRLRNAASAFERILLIAPNLAVVRLLHGTVLVRLDSLDEATLEIRRAISLGLSVQEQAFAVALLDEMERRQSPIAIFGSVSTGFQFDDNRTAVSESGSALAFDIPVPSGDEHSDVALVSTGRIGVSVPVVKRNKGELFGSAAVFNSDQLKFEELDLLVLSVSGGGRFQAGETNVSLRLMTDYALLDDRPFFHGTGGALEIGRVLMPRVSANVVTASVYERFIDIAGGAANPLRNGPSFQGGIGFAIQATENFTTALGYVHEFKRAGDDAFSFNADQLSLSNRLTLFGGDTVTLGTRYRSERYDDADVLISETVRHDQSVAAGMSYSLSIGRLFNIGKILDGSLLTARYEYQKVFSNIPNFELSNNRASVSIVVPFSF
jgi:tetratricopeptide (TPR) repeat protein